MSERRLTEEELNRWFTNWMLENRQRLVNMCARGGDDILTVDLDSPPLEYWSRAIIRIEERRKVHDTPWLQELENYAHMALSVEISHMEREP
jgi:hypothetical protein